MTVNMTAEDKPHLTPLILLVPWDPDSEEHAGRMKVQRIACGWKLNSVDGWRDKQRKGEIGLHWVVLHPSHPDTAALLDKHSAAHPNERKRIHNTATSILGQPYEADPIMPFFQPIGHISLDSITPEPELGTSLADGTLSLTTFYISTALQSRGLGGAALNQCEKMARDEMGAKAITLETISNEECRPDSPRRIALKRPAPTVTNQDWYMRHGYVVYDEKKVAWVDIDENGNEWPCGSVFLRKMLV